MIIFKYFLELLCRGLIRGSTILDGFLIITFFFFFGWGGAGVRGPGIFRDYHFRERSFKKAVSRFEKSVFEIYYFSQIFTTYVLASADEF